MDSAKLLQLPKTFLAREFQLSLTAVNGLVVALLVHLAVATGQLRLSICGHLVDLGLMLMEIRDLLWSHYCRVKIWPCYSDWQALEWKLHLIKIRHARVSSHSCRIVVLVGALIKNRLSHTRKRYRLNMCRM